MVLIIRADKNQQQMKEEKKYDEIWNIEYFLNNTIDICMAYEQRFDGVRKKCSFVKVKY